MQTADTDSTTSSPRHARITETDPHIGWAAEIAAIDRELKDEPGDDAEERLWDRRIELQTDIGWTPARSLAGLLVQIEMLQETDESDRDTLRNLRLTLERMARERSFVIAEPDPLLRLAIPFDCGVQIEAERAQWFRDEPTAERRGWFIEARTKAIEAAEAIMAATPTSAEGETIKARAAVWLRDVGRAPIPEATVEPDKEEPIETACRRCIRTHDLGAAAGWCDAGRG